MSALERRLVDLERRLNPAAPARDGTGIEVLGYGEVSAVLGLADLPDRVLKRMSGFRSRERAGAYIDVVERYLAILGERGVAVAPTEPVLIEPAPGRVIVYLLQPRFAAARLGNALLRSQPVEALRPFFEAVLDLVARLLDDNATRCDGREVAVDAQLSNWYWPPGGVADRRPVLVDVGTPFMRLHGDLEVGADVFLCAYPAPLRWWMRRTRAVERYIDDYFDFCRTVADLLGNFIKEGAGEKLPEAIALVNQWMAQRARSRGRGDPIDEQRVRAYYAKDAATLELSLRARRLGRFVTTKLLRRRYDFILPGAIRRR